MKLLTLKDRRADRKRYDGRWFSCADWGVVDIGQMNGCEVEVGHQPRHRDAHRSPYRTWCIEGNQRPYSPKALE